MTIEIYHNPKCSKSRQALTLLEGKGITPKIRLYLENAPSKAELQDVLKKLKIKATALLRTEEDIYKSLVAKEGKPDEATALRWMVENPKLIQRPIVIKGEKAKIGRPPEEILSLL